MLKSGFRNKIMLGAMALAGFVISGCLAGGGSLTNLPNNETALVKLKIRLGKIDSRVDVNPNVSLNKGSEIDIQNLVVTFTSNLQDTIRDTVAARDFGGFGTEEELEQSVLVNVSLRALRWWNIDIESHDQYDSVVHKGTAGPFPSKGGQTMDLSIPLLNSRFLMYEARYALPTDIYAAALADSLRVLQKIYFFRLLLEIDGDTVHDSSSFDPSITQAGSRFIMADTTKLKGAAGKFFFRANTGLGGDTVTHVQTYEYVKVGSHTFRMSAFGYLEGDSIGRTQPRLLYQGSGVTDVISGGVPTPQTVKLDYMGPGSKHLDPSVPVKEDDWNGIALTVTFGRVKSGSINVGINPSVPIFKASARHF